MDNEIDFYRYIAGLRRGLWLIVAVGLIGAALGGVTGIRSSVQASFDLQPAERGAESLFFGIEAADLDPAGIRDLVASGISSDEFEAELSEIAGSDVTLDVLPPANATAISVAISGADADAVSRAVDATIEAAQESYATETGVILSAVETNLQRKLETNAQQELEVNEEIRAAAPDQELLVEGLLVQLRNLRNETAVLESQLGSLDQFESTVSSGLRPLFANQEPQRSRGAVTMAVVGLILGSFLAAGGVVVRVALDRTIRSRRDLERLGLTNLVAILSSSRADAELDVAAAALQRSVQRSEHTMAQLVPIGAPLDDSGWSSAVSGRLEPGELTIRPPLHDGASDSLASTSSAVTLIGVRWGVDRADEVTLSANRLAAAGASEVGVVLWDVADAEVGGVER